MGWRSAFIVVALPGLLAAALTVGYIDEPMRGASERAVAVSGS
jgi:predicted MFS family arabinose efflux permease